VRFGVSSITRSRFQSFVTQFAKLLFGYKKSSVGLKREAKDKARRRFSAIAVVEVCASNTRRNVGTNSPNGWSRNSVVKDNQMTLQSLTLCSGCAFCLLRVFFLFISVAPGAIVVECLKEFLQCAL